MHAEFRGMLPWAFDLDIIEIIVDGETIDLHNEATLNEIVLGFAGEPVVRLSFVGDDDRAFSLRFGGAHDIEFAEDEGGYWPVDIRAVETLYGITYENSHDAKPAFEVRTLLGVLTFRASSVEFAFG